jgi:mono/diheme cytochrome c family protein
MALSLTFASFVGAPASAQTTDDSTDESTEQDGVTAEAETVDTEADDQLRLGAEVYGRICASCHQAGGVGIPGTFPPLIDNPHTDDASYIEEVINEGRSGELTVAGETYNGVMPKFSTMSEDDKTAVIAYIQSGFAEPAAAVVETAAPTGPVAGTELPLAANLTALIAYLAAALVATLVLAPRLVGMSNRLESTWLDAWMKAVAIVVLVALLTIFIPNWALTSGTVSKADGVIQDLVGVGLWSIGLATVLGGLWWAHKEDRI